MGLLISYLLARSLDAAVVGSSQGDVQRLIRGGPSNPSPPIHRSSAMDAQISVPYRSEDIFLASIEQEGYKSQAGWWVNGEG